MTIENFNYRAILIYFLQVVREKRELEEKFELITNEVKKNADLNNVILDQRLQSLLNQYNARVKNPLKNLCLK